MMAAPNAANGLALTALPAELLGRPKTVYRLLVPHRSPFASPSLLNVFVGPRRWPLGSSAAGMGSRHQLE